MANFTQAMLPSQTDPIAASQSQKISASLSRTLSPTLSLATSASTVSELTSQGDFFPFTSSTYLSQNASSSISESLLLFL